MAIIITVLVVVGLLVLIFRKVSNDYEKHMDALLNSCLSQGAFGNVLSTGDELHEFSVLYRTEDLSLARAVVTATNKHEATFNFVRDYQISVMKVEEVNKL